VVPTGTLPKLMAEGPTANWPASATVPVPVNETERTGFEPLELIARLPVALPPDCGANKTLNVTLWAAFRVSGRLIPLTLNPVPPGVIWEMVRAEPPEFVRVSARVALLPVLTLPKLRLAGLALSWPGVTPVPDNGTFKTELAALDVIARLPLTPPLEVGENLTLKLALWPAFNIRGKLSPFAVNPEAVAPTAEMVTLAPPELVRVSASVWELPTRTLPKPRLAGLVVSWPEVTPTPDTGNVTVVELRESPPYCHL